MLPIWDSTKKTPAASAAGFFVARNPGPWGQGIRPMLSLADYPFPRGQTSFGICRLSRAAFARLNSTSARASARVRRLRRTAQTVRCARRASKNCRQRTVLRSLSAKRPNKPGYRSERVRPQFASRTSSSRCQNIRWRTQKRPPVREPLHVVRRPHALPRPALPSQLIAARFCLWLSRDQSSCKLPASRFKYGFGFYPQDRRCW